MFWPRIICRDHPGGDVASSKEWSSDCQLSLKTYRYSSLSMICSIYDSMDKVSIYRFVHQHERWGDDSRHPLNKPSFIMSLRESVSNETKEALVNCLQSRRGKLSREKEGKEQVCWQCGRESWLESASLRLSNSLSLFLSRVRDSRGSLESHYKSFTMWMPVMPLHSSERNKNRM